MRRKVLIVYPILHHYRRGVFLRLDRDPRLEVAFASASGGADGIASMNSDELQKYHELRNFRMLGMMWQRGIIRLLMHSEYNDVIFLGDPFVLSTWGGALVARRRGARVYFWTIGWHRPERGVKRAVRMAFYRLSNALMLYGSIAQSIGIDLGFPEQRMHVIGNSIDAPPESTDSADIRLPAHREGDVWVGAVVRLNHQKRLDLLVEAAAILRDQGMAICLLIVGEGPARSSLEHQSRKLQVPLYLPGAAYSALDLKSFYERVELTVVPSAVGLTAIQSLDAGVPVISDDSAYDQMPEWESIIPGRTGATFAAGDAFALADAIRRVLEMLHSNRDEVARACRDEVLAHWSSTAHAARIVEVLNNDGPEK